MMIREYKYFERSIVQDCWFFYIVVVIIIITKGV